MTLSGRYEQLRTAVEQAIATASTPSQHAYAPPVQGLAEQLPRLHASGALMEQKFAVAKTAVQSAA